MKKNQTFSNGEDVPAKLLSERGLFFFLFIYPHSVVWINNEWCKMDVTIHLDQILISLIFSYFSTNQFSLKENKKKYLNLSCVITGGVWESMKSLFFFFFNKYLNQAQKTINRRLSLTTLLHFAIYFSSLKVFHSKIVIKVILHCLWSNNIRTNPLLF